MPTTHYENKSKVRHAGKTTTVFVRGTDKHGVLEQKGDRRARQIAKRHWLKQNGFWWSSGGGGGRGVTRKNPDEEEVDMKKYRGWG